jgi:hypothetical protein
MSCTSTVPVLTLHEASAAGGDPVRVVMQCVGTECFELGTPSWREVVMYRVRPPPPSWDCRQHYGLIVEPRQHPVLHMLTAGKQSDSVEQSIFVYDIFVKCSSWKKRRKGTLILAVAGVSMIYKLAAKFRATG